MCIKHFSGAVAGDLSILLRREFSQFQSFDFVIVLLSLFLLLSFLLNIKNTKKIVTCITLFISVCHFIFSFCYFVISVSLKFAENG